MSPKKFIVQHCGINGLLSLDTVSRKCKYYYFYFLDKNGISYQMYDNSFFRISDAAKAQEPADKFDSKSLCRQLDLFAHKANPYLDTVERIFHQGCLWCVDQCEYAAGVMFKSREALEDIHPWQGTHFMTSVVLLFFLSGT